MSQPLPKDDASLIAQRRQAIARHRRRSLGLLRSLGRSNRLFPRKLVVTRDGKWIIAMALLLGVGAVNTGNNLLYLVLSLLISIIAISGVLSEANLRNLRVARYYGRELEVGVATMLRTEVHNDKTRASFSIEVNELVEEGLVRRPGYVLHLRPGEVGQAFTMVRPTRRGPILSEGMQVVTAYPFGFARKTRVLEDQQRWWALPPIWKTPLLASGATERGFVAEVNRKGAGSELMGLRDWRPGDARRDVHWKVSARRGRLITREWQAEANQAVIVEFVHLAPTDSDDPNELDPACARVAGICAALLDTQLAVGLCTDHELIEPQTNEQGEQLLRIRRSLAGLSFADRPPPPTWPLEDDVWSQHCRRAWAQQQGIDGVQGFRWWAGHGVVGAYRVRVIFASRSSISVSGPTPDVVVQLSPQGEVLEVRDLASEKLGVA